MKVKSYKELIVWQRAMDFVTEVYSVIKMLPKEESFGLCNQMRRAAISIPSNIAEGQARNSTKEFVHFLSIANGSRAEIETQLLLCVKIGYVKEKNIEKSMLLLQEISKMIYSLMRSLTTNH